MSYLSELLRPEQIQLELRGPDKPAVLKELVELVPEIRKEPGHQELFLHALLERERLHTTAIGDGIALPHARNPMGSLLKRPVMVFGRHAAGVPFGALDTKPVQLLFLIGSPNLTDHLAMLSRLSRALRDIKLRTNLLAARRAEEVLIAIEEAEQRTGKPS
jgi:nitrogen PTS system EIIA component